MLNTLRAIAFYKMWSGAVLVIYSLHFLFLPELRVEAQQIFGDWVSSPRFIFYMNWGLLAGIVSVWIGLTLSKSRARCRQAAYLTILELFNPARSFIIYHAGLLFFWRDTTDLAFPTTSSAAVPFLILVLTLVEGFVLAPRSSWILFQAKECLKYRKAVSLQNFDRIENLTGL